MITSLILCLLGCFVSSEIVPDSRIAYSQLTGDHWQIWIVGADGQFPEQLTFTPSDKRHPAWAPDCSFLVYNDSNGRLYRHDFENGETRQLRAIPAASESEISIEGRLAHQCVRYAPGYLLEIWTSNQDGTDRKVLTKLPRRHYSPSWSSDGRRIVVAEFDPDDEQFSLALLDASGEGYERVASGTSRIATPTWSASGDQIAFIRETDSNNDLWVLDLESGEQTQLTFHPDLDTQPSFAPDGEQIVFVSRRDGALRLWTVRSDGREVARPLIGSGVTCRDPAWSPAALSDAPDIILNARLTAQHIELEGGAHSQLPFTLASDAFVTVTVSAEDGSALFSIVLGDLEEGSHQFSWDGRSNEGVPVRPGVYILSLNAKNERGESEWNPSLETGGEFVRVERLELDEKNQNADFDLPVFSRVRVRFGLDKGPMVDTSVDFEPLAAGKHSVQFSGEMSVGWGGFWTHPDRHVWVTAFALPTNAVLVESTTGAELLARKRLPNNVEGPNALNHAKHDPAGCLDPEISAMLRRITRSNEAGLPVVDSSTELVITVPDPSTRAQFESGRFEVMIFLDDHFLMEDEDSVLPFNFDFDVSRFPEGEHSFLINVTTFSNHTGSIFLPFVIERQAR